MKLYWRIFLSVLSCLLLIVSSYDEFSLIAWLALIPYFIVIAKSNMRSAILLSWLAGIIFFAGITLWFTEYSYSYWFVIIIILSIYFIFYGAVFKIIYNKIKLPFFRILLISSVWIAVEFFRHRTFLAFPWGVLGYFQHNHLEVMQISKFTGVIGVSLLIILFNLCISEIILYIIDLKPRLKLKLFHHKDLSNNTPGEEFKAALSKKLAYEVFYKTSVFKSAAIIFSIAVLNSFAGLIYLKTNASSIEGEKLNVALVQPNISFDDKFETDSGFLIPDKTGNDGKYFLEETDLVVFPESIIWGTVENKRNKTFYEWVKKTAGNEDLYFIMGQILWDENENYYNAVQLYNPELEIIGRYNKIHPLPCAEYMPYPDVLGFLSFLNIAKLNITPDYKFSLIDFPGKGSIGPNICFESTLQLISRTFRKIGAGSLFTFTDTAGFKDSIVARHHLIFSQVRAIENNSFMVHSGNNGISAIIDPNGRILVKSEIIKKDVIYGSIYFNNRNSFYSRYGELILYIYFGFSLIISMIFEIKLSRRKK